MGVLGRIEQPGDLSASQMRGHGGIIGERIGDAGS